MQEIVFVNAKMLSSPHWPAPVRNRRHDDGHVYNPNQEVCHVNMLTISSSHFLAVFLACSRLSQIAQIYHNHVRVIQSKRLYDRAYDR